MVLWQGPADLHHLPLIWSRSGSEETLWCFLPDKFWECRLPFVQSPLFTRLLEDLASQPLPFRFSGGGQIPVHCVLQRKENIKLSKYPIKIHSCQAWAQEGVQEGARSARSSFQNPLSNACPALGPEWPGWKESLKKAALLSRLSWTWTHSWPSFPASHLQPPLPSIGYHENWTVFLEPNHCPAPLQSLGLLEGISIGFIIHSYQGRNKF